MEEIQHLIEKFWDGNITAEEKKHLFNYMNEHEGVWKQFMEKSYHNSDQELLSEVASDRVLGALREQIKPAKVVYIWSRWAAAAMIIILAGWGIFQYNNNRHSIAVNTISVKQLVQHRNTGRDTETFELSDGSVIKLYPAGTISYYPSFDSLERNISLEGTAYFKVAKDRRPFSVTAKGFTTIALGTAFTVSTTNAGSLSVQLLEGKVVVKAAKGSGMVMKETYLTPGQEFVVNTVIKQFHVQTFATETPKKVVHKEEHVAIMSFNKTPLKDVLTQLSKYYRVQFDIDMTVIEGLSFTGTIEKADSLHGVLSAICNMNDLTFRDEGGKIIISKQN